MVADRDERHDAQLAAVLEQLRGELRSGRQFDLAEWQRRCPELAHELGGLVEILRDLETAVQDWTETAEAITAHVFWE